MIELPEDINFSNLSINADDIYFNEAIGHIEDILLDEKFLEVHTKFMEKYWTEFEDNEENKFIYTDIFHEYIGTIEKHLEEELRKRMSGFQMNKFETELKSRQNELDGEVFEMLETFSDFCAFKTMFIDYRNMKEGKTVDFSLDLSVSKYEIQETPMQY